MQQYFIQYLGSMVNISQIGKQLEKKGMLVQSNSKSLYKRFAGKYHFVISCRLLRIYYEIKKKDSSVNVENMLEIGGFR